MIWLFLLALAAWITYRVAVLADFESSPLVAWWSVIIAGLVLMIVAVNFAFMDGPFPILPLEWVTADGSRQSVGMGAPVVLVYDVFALMGPIGNAVFWGFVGLWCFKKAWDGGWFRYARFLRDRE